MGRIPGLARNDHPVLYPYGVFEASDGKFNVAVAHDSMWPRLCQAIDADDLGRDPRYIRNDSRVTHREELREKLNQRFRTQSKDYWNSHLNENGIPAGPVYALDEVFANDQVNHQELIITIDDPVLGGIRMLGSALRFSAGFDPGRNPAPRLGEHSREILTEVGFPGIEIERMIETGAIAEWSPTDG